MVVLGDGWGCGFGFLMVNLVLEYGGLFGDGIYVVWVWIDDDQQFWVVSVSVGVNLIFEGDCE